MKKKIMVLMMIGAPFLVMNGEDSELETTRKSFLSRIDTIEKMAATKKSVTELQKAYIEILKIAGNDAKKMSVFFDLSSDISYLESEINKAS